jgi:hypothetical protein
MIFFSFLANFSYFPLRIVFQKLLETDRTGKKNYHFEKGVDGFGSVSLIVVLILPSEELSATLYIIMIMARTS